MNNNKRKPTLMEKVQNNQQSINLYAALTGRERLDLSLPGITDKPVVKRAAAQPSLYPLEHEEQVSFVKWFRLQHQGVRIHSVPNSAARSFELAAWLKAEGMTKGVFDLQIPAWHVPIEFKRQKGAYAGPVAIKNAVTAEQQDWFNYYTSIGWTPIIAWGCDDGIGKIGELLK